MTFLFAWRYFKAKKSTNVINIIAWICIIAIVIGTTALILVLSVFNGFESLVKSLYASFYPDIKISPAAQKTMTVTPAQLQKLRGLHNVQNYSLVVEEKAIVQNADNQALAYIKGVDSHYNQVNTVHNHVFNGVFDVGDSQQPKLVLGAGIESALGVRPTKDNAPLMLYVPIKNNAEHFDETENIASDTIRYSGSFMIQQDFDTKFAITNIQFLKKIMGLQPNEFSGIEVVLKDKTKDDETLNAIAAIFGNGYKVQNRYQQNQSLYAVMNLERWVFYAVLCIILVVAAFNMVGALTMLVLEKQKDINVLNALGAGRNFILKVFLSEGLLLALIGGGIGMLLSLILILLQIRFHIIPLTGGSFLIDYFPVELQITDFLLVGATVLIIAFIASWLPALKASKQEFSLRSE